MFDIKKTLLAAVFAMGMVAAATAMDRPEPGTWTFSTDGELISLWVNEAPLKDVLADIQMVTPAEINLDDLPDKNITIRYRNIYLDELLAKMNVSFVLTYSQDGTDGEYHLESAWVSHFKPQQRASAPAGKADGSGPVNPSKVGPMLTALGYKDAAEASNDVGNVYRLPYPVAMKMDGDLSEWPEDIPWHSVDHTMGRGSATNNADASFQFASAADEENLYFAIKVADDGRVMDTEGMADHANEDSIELMLGQLGSELGRPISLRRHQVWRKGADGSLVSSGRQFIGLSTGVRAIIMDSEDGYEVEVSVPLKTVGEDITGGSELAFTIGLNDDDDGGERENRLEWKSPSSAGKSPGLKFVPVTGIR